MTIIDNGLGLVICMVVSIITITMMLLQRAKVIQPEDMSILGCIGIMGLGTGVILTIAILFLWR